MHRIYKSKNRKGGDHFGQLGIYGRMSLKCDGVVWIRLAQVVTSGVLL